MSETSAQPVTNSEPAPRPPRDTTTGVFKIIVGLVFGAATVYLFDLHTKQQPSGGAGAITGIAAGLCLWLAIGGIATATGRRFTWPIGASLLVACAVTGGIVEPRLVKAKIVAAEQAAWDRLQASPKRVADYDTYLSWAEEPRPGLSGPRALALARQELAKLDADPAIHVNQLRDLLRKVSFPDRGDPADSMKPAIALVRDALAREYGRALDELNKRAATSPAKREFPDDPAMRAAFAAVLGHLARSEDDHVYLAFASENKIGEPAPTERVTRPGDAFAPDREERRHRSFQKSLGRAIAAAFGGDAVISLALLEPRDTRKGRVVFEVSCVTRRIPGEFTLTRDGQETGKLMNFAVDWQFAILDASGRELTRNRSTSTPAESVSLTLDKRDPFWAPYSALMDSAYYNYCRQIAGRLGLQAPPARASYRFE